MITPCLGDYGDGHIDALTFELMILDKKSHHLFAIIFIKHEIILMKEDGDIAHYEEYDILKCTEGTSFWLSWSGGVLQLGFGTQYGIDRVLETENYPALLELFHKMEIAKHYEMPSDIIEQTFESLIIVNTRMYLIS